MQMSTIAIFGGGAGVRGQMSGVQCPTFDTRTDGTPRFRTRDDLSSLFSAVARDPYRQ